MKSVRHTTNVYSLLIFLYWFANALPLALLILLLQSRGLDLLQASVLFGIHALTVVLLEVPTGSLADIVGRKRVTIWAALLMMVGYGLFLTAFTFPLLLFGGVVYGVSRALASGALDAWFVDTVQAHDPQVDLQPLFAKSGVMTLVGLALGTLAGGLIPLGYRFLPLSGSAILTDLSLPLVASLIVQLIRLLLIGLLVVEERPASTRSLRTIVTTMPDFIGSAIQLSRRSKLIRWILLTTFGSGFVMISLENFWQPHFAELLGGSEGNSLIFGIIMAGNFVLGAVGNMLSPALAQRLGNRLGLLTGVVEFLRGAALFLLVMQSSVPLASLFFWTVYFGMGVAGPAVGTILNEEITADFRSTMLSIQSMVSYIGVFAGSLVLGSLAQRVSISAAWLLGSIVLMVLLFPYLRIDRLYRTKVASKKAEQEGQNAQLQTI